MATRVTNAVLLERLEAMAQRLDSVVFNLSDTNNEVRALRDEIQQLTVSMAEAAAREDARDERLRRIEQIVLGNGEDGMRVRLDRVEHGMAELQRWKWLIVTTVASALVTAILNIIGLAH